MGVSDEFFPTEVIENPETGDRQRLFAALFNTPLGQEVLACLREKTIEKTTMPGYAADGVGFGMHMALREGENELYRWIVAQIKDGMREPHAPKKGKGKRK